MLDKDFVMTHYSNLIPYPTGRKFSDEYKLCHFTNVRFARFNSVCYYIYENTSMIAYIPKIQKSKFAYTLFRELYHSVPGR